MKILIGSGAAMHRIPSFKRLYEPDIDYITDCHALKDEIPNSDISVVDSELMNLFENESKVSGIATINDLLTIKLSHLPWDIKWKKHQRDYLVLKKYGGLPNVDLLNSLREHWKDVHGSKTHLSLYKTKDEFFDDYVTKVEDHDRLHELVAYPNSPVYVSCLKEGHEVFIDKDKFLELSFEDKIRMFREEINVIAVERWILNPKCRGKITFTDAYHRSLHKTVTALTKGWASEFICENLVFFIKPNPQEVSHLFKTLSINF